ncbi:MAG: helix-turn-helix domain-containing protein [Anderseniella sp.]
MTEHMPTNRLMTASEVAAELKLGNSTIWRKVKQGHLPPPIKIGGSTRWLRQEIEIHIAKLTDQRDAPEIQSVGNGERGES